MSDFFDKALLLGAGLETKLKELACELQSTGKKTREEKEPCAVSSETEDLSAKEKIENRLVTEGVKGIKELLNLIKDGKDKVDGEVSGVTDTIASKMGLATASELATVKEMARVAREKADALEKRLEALEK